jgi:hypothetical protein
MGWVKGHWGTRNGKRYWVRAHYRRDPGYSSTPGPARVPVHGKATSPSRVVTIAVALTFAAGGVTAGVLATGSPSDVSDVKVSQGDVAPTSSTFAQVGFKGVESALFAAGYNNIDYAIDFGGNCEAHSYGLVKSFFKAHPCRWLTRAYLAIHDGSESEAIIAISWVGMPSVASAEAYKKLVDEGGTGNVTELSREVGPYRAVKFDGEFYASGEEGSSVWNVQVQPVGLLPSAVADNLLNDSRQQ